MVAVVRWYLSAFHAGRKVVIAFCLFVFFSETGGEVYRIDCLSVTFIKTWNYNFTFCSFLLAIIKI